MQVHAIDRRGATQTSCGKSLQGVYAQIRHASFAWRNVTCPECLNPLSKPVDIRSTWTIEEGTVKELI